MTIIDIDKKTPIEILSGAAVELAHAGWVKGTIQTVDGRMCLDGALRKSAFGTARPYDEGVSLTNHKNLDAYQAARRYTVKAGIDMGHDCTLLAGNYVVWQDIEAAEDEGSYVESLNDSALKSGESAERVLVRAAQLWSQDHSVTGFTYEELEAARQEIPADVQEKVTALDGLRALFS